MGELEEKVMAREIGGSMSPIWNSMVEAGRTQVCRRAAGTGKGAHSFRMSGTQVPEQSNAAFRSCTIYCFLQVLYQGAVQLTVASRYCTVHRIIEVLYNSMFFFG